MKKTYHGSCHCGAIKFEADIDLAEGIRKCNCSFCLKLGYKKSFTGYEALRVIEGKDTMRDYRAVPSNWPQGDINHYCARTAARKHSRAAISTSWAAISGR